MSLGRGTHGTEPQDLGKGTDPQWWNAPPGHPETRGTWDAPLERKFYTTLGMLKRVQHPSWQYYEHQHLVYCTECLTMYWPLIQGGVCPAAMAKWKEVFESLELDRRAALDLMLLAQSGLAGRAEANEIIWQLLSHWALKDTYEDLSHKVSSLCSYSRRSSM